MKSMMVLHFHKADCLLDMDFINITRDTTKVSAHLHVTYTEYNQLFEKYNALERDKPEAGKETQGAYKNDMVIEQSI
jgi:hypothetical protein